MDFLWGIGLLLFGSLVPGLALAAVWVDRRDPVIFVTVGIVLGMFVLPSLYFGVAILFGTNIGPELILATSAAVLIGCTAHSILGGRGEARPSPPQSKPG